MLGAYSEAVLRPPPGLVVVRRRQRERTLSPTTHQAVRHGIHGAVKAACLSAALMASAGVAAGSHGPVVLSVPAAATSVTQVTVEHFR